MATDGVMNSARLTTEQISRLIRHSPCRCLLVGICGAGMRSLAEAMLEAGHDVHGTDSCLDAPSDLVSERTSWTGRMPVLHGWQESASQFIHETDLIISSLAVPENDQRLMVANANGVPVVWLSQAIAALWNNHRQICVAGTHGKTTTAALIDSVLCHADLDPGLFLGGQLMASGRSGRQGAGQYAVLESCEYRQSFHELRPSVAVVTGIDRDHFDTFPSASDELNAYNTFLSQSCDDAVLVVNADDPRALTCGNRTDRRMVTIGTGEGVDLRAVDVQIHENGSSFRVAGSDTDGTVFNTTLAGFHNIQNILAAVAVARSVGVDFKTISRGVAAFQGVRRRFEYRGEFRGATLIDDYAHHPTAVAATIVAAKQRFPGRRVVVVFEPHQSSRFSALSDEFRDALSAADESLVLPVLAIRENLPRSQCIRLSGDLVRQLNSLGHRAFLMANLDQATNRIDHAARQGDVVITMGAGRTNRIHDELNRKIQRDTAA
jgi:UDP-N-acetylmuramate--alanine ligase